MEIEVLIEMKNAVYLILMFDLDTTKKNYSSVYRVFKKHILKQGFIMLQYSVYYRVFDCSNSAKEYEKNVPKFMESINGTIECFIISAKQYQKRIILGKSKYDQNKGLGNTEQLSLF